jgi:hypothetical protein
LWQSHRFDARPPSVLVSLGDAAADQFRIARRRYAPWVEAWLPTAQRMETVVALVGPRGLPDGQPAVLEVDRALLGTLREVQRGLTRTGWTLSASRKVARFVAQLVREGERDAARAQAGSAPRQIRLRGVESGAERRVAVLRDPPRYAL